MPCYHPIPAWRGKSGAIQLHKELADGIPLKLPCGGCVGCRTSAARSWALRCHLELQQHPTAVFTTLTYSDESLPATLQKRHVSLWMKRLRKAADRKIRYFAAGEYGEQNARPHYHALVYGISSDDRVAIDNAWQMGHTKTVPITPAAINYTAGYCAKKLGYRLDATDERVDPETGEVYTWQPPFIQMSRRPGIGGDARQFTQSWRSYAVYQGAQIKVPRFLHEAWKATATPEQKEELAWERSKLLAETEPRTKDRLAAGELLAIARQKLKGQRRKL